MTVRLAITALLLSLLIGVTNAVAQPVLDYVRQIDLPTNGRDVTVASDHLWVTIDTTLYRLPLDPPDALPEPALILDTRAYSLVARNGLLAVGLGNAGLQLVDINDPQAPQSLAVTRTPGSVNDIQFLDDNHLVLAAGYSGLITVDISVPTAPQLLAYLPVHGEEHANYLEIQGDRLLTGVENLGAVLLDASDPTDLTPLDTVAVSWDIGGLAFHEDGGVAYVATYRWIIPPYDPAFSQTWIHRLAVNDDQLALAHTHDAGTNDFLTHSTPLLLDGDYVIAMDATLTLYDWSEPTEPVVVDAINHSGVRMTRADDRIFTVTDTRLREYLLTDDQVTPRKYRTPAPEHSDIAEIRNAEAVHPRLRASTGLNAASAGEGWGLDTPGLQAGTGHSIIGKEQTGTGERGGLADLDEFGWDSLSTVDLAFTPSALLAFDDTHLLARSNDQVVVLDVSDPAVMAEVGSYPVTEAWIYGWAVDGSRLYLALRDDGLDVIDLSDPTDPQLITTWFTGFNVADVAAQSDTVYAVVEGRLLQLDGTDPLSPIELDAYPGMNENISKVAQQGDWLVVGEMYWPGEFPVTATTWITKSLTGSFYPVKRLTYNGRPRRLELFPDYVFIEVTDGEYWMGTRMLSSWDDPFYLREIASGEWEQGWDSYGLYGASQSGDRLVTSMGEPDRFWVSLFDTAEPSAPALLQESDGMGMQVMHLSMPNLYIYGYNSLTVYELWETGVDDDRPEDILAAQPRQLALSPAYPNPFNPTATITLAVPQSGDVRVTLHDITGRQVATLARGRMSAGQHAMTIDGSRLASGSYFVHAVSGQGQRHVRRVTLVK